jgi:hypothetical protein
MVEFRIAEHCVLPAQIVEIWVDGVFRGAVYPQEPDGIRFMSRYIAAGPEKEQSAPDSWCFTFKKP